MACFTATLGVFILSGFINFLAAKKETCDLYAVVGQSSTLPFVFEGLSNLHVLRWTHNGTIIFYRQGLVSAGKSEDISATGSLLLKNPQFSSAGTYEAKVLNPNGTLAKAWTNFLCVMDKVSKPQLTYVCNPKSSAVNLNCLVAKPERLVFSWTLDGKTLTSETRPTLSISLAQLKGETSFTCSVANKLSRETSDTVRPSCKSPPPPPLLCFPSKTVTAVLAGGAGLILLLLTIIIILCCCIKNRMTRGNKGQLRMLSLNKRDPDSISPDYETMRPSEDSPPQSPASPPRACYENVSQPEAQTENRPAQLSTDAGQQPSTSPSPVPKPRTKTPQTPNI
ncbi:hepatic and glial cell adhesion molecule-like [Centropristis striata]|uniref:hepatic and glial cell adhesion molecule-like n=1 Tax=Centropristis striata TaxID=184440 RepID=UPI0027E0930E|nr:hepatic and glial cell adhesion molecule-like [Centropristis striata]